MTRVLVLSRIFRGVTMGYGEEFKQAGCTVKTITSLVDCSKWNIIFRLKKRIGLSNESYFIRKDKSFAKKVISICEEFHPDIIYVCHGTQLRPDTINYLKSRYYIVVDLIDRLDFFPKLKEYVPYYNMVYTYNKDDCEIMNNQGIECRYMPATGNPHIFKKMNINKDIDICFVGATYPEASYGDRLVIMNKLIDDFPDKRIFVGGQCAPIRRPEKFIRWITDKRKRKVFNNKDIDSYECNIIYNRSKICININRINTGDGWSERFGNIMYSGAFQIVTYNENIVRTFGDAVETFKSYDELKDKIKYLLDNEDELNARTEYGYKEYSRITNSLWNSFNIVDDVLKDYKEWKNDNK